MNDFSVVQVSSASIIATFNLYRRKGKLSKAFCDFLILDSEKKKRRRPSMEIEVGDFYGFIRNVQRITKVREHKSKLLN